MPDANEHDLVVIGAGPGGYVAALRAAQLGMHVAVIDDNEQLGGTCLRIGCIPSKALLESSHLFAAAAGPLAEHGVTIGKLALDLPRMLRRKDDVVSALAQGIQSLLKKAKIRHYRGRGRFDGSAGSLTVESGKKQQRVVAQRTLIATGSVSASLPGVAPAPGRIGTSTEALEFESVPAHLVVIGAGAIGLELGTVWRRLGAKVTVLEYLDRILPGVDEEIARETQKILTKQGIEFRLGARVNGAKASAGGCVVEVEGQANLKCDQVLLAVGRRPFTEGLALDKVGIKTDAKGFITVHGETYETSVPGVFAIGDVIGPPMLAHKAEEEGIACVERMATGYGHVNYNAIPYVVYTSPEVAGVGRTEEQLQADGASYRKGQFPFLASGRARSVGHTEGRVKILADKKTDRILGVHIVGPQAGELIAEAAVAMEFGASSEDLARCCHAHPTLSEAVKEAALAVDGRALHL